MRKFVLTALILMIFIVGKSQTNYYVSLTGNNNYSGLSEANAWRTITYAISETSPLVAGDTVFVRAGNYGNENIIIEKDGEPDNPIVIQGYQTIPGDSPDLNYSYGDELDETVMPLIDGGNRANGEGINIDGRANISIRNIQITNCEYGIYTWSVSSNNLLLDNIIVMYIGDINASYSGLGLGIIYADNNIVRNCIVVNSCAEGITVVADNNLIENCQVYCDEDMTYDASTDYYISVEGNNNTFKNCYIERVGDLEHVGHGMGLKGNCEHNLFEDCTAKDMRGGGFYVRHRGAKYNEFRNCTAIGTLDDVMGFLIRDGASYNEFNNCVSDSCTSAIVFLDTDEDNGAQYCGRHNTFNNCIVNKPVWAISFLDYSVPSPADSNLFANCTFNEGSNLFESLRENYDNEMINCIVSGFQNLNTGTEALNFNYSYSNFYDNSFSTPLGEGNISVNPHFVNSELGDFHLQISSPCIDAGTENNAPYFDFDGITRPQGSAFDIGAFEFVEQIGIIENTNEEFIVFPNPTSGKLVVPNTFINNKFQIISSTGAIVRNGILYTKELDVSYLDPGLYFVVIEQYNSTKPSISRFIKTKM